MRARTWASQAWGSTPFFFAVTMRLYMAAARSPPRSEPQNNHDLRPRLRARDSELRCDFLAPGLRRRKRRFQRGVFFQKSLPGGVHDAK